jgi:hypothetical protein
MYYKYDKTENGTTTRPQTTFRFNLGSSNAHLSNTYNRSDLLLKCNIWFTTNGDSNFCSGNGRSFNRNKIPGCTINLKDLYK